MGRTSGIFLIFYSWLPLFTFLCHASVSPPGTVHWFLFLEECRFKRSGGSPGESFSKQWGQRKLKVESKFRWDFFWWMFYWVLAEMYVLIKILLYYLCRRSKFESIWHNKELFVCCIFIIHIVSLLEISLPVCLYVRLFR